MEGSRRRRCGGLVVGRRTGRKFRRIICRLMSLWRARAVVGCLRAAGVSREERARGGGLRNAVGREGLWGPDEAVSRVELRERERIEGGTPSRFSPSSRCRGITVTCSISHRNAISAGVRPGVSGAAIVRVGHG